MKGHTPIGAIALAIIFIFNSCTDEENPLNGGNETGTREFVLDIKDASNLLVLNDASKKSVSEENSGNLYKITYDGELEKVSFINADTTLTDTSNVTSHIEVESIIRASDEYLVFTGYFYLAEGNRYLEDQNGNLMRYQTILIRIEDGAIFDLDDVIDLKTFHYKGRKILPNDSLGNFYYSNGPQIFKLDVSNPDELFKEVISPEGVFSTYFEINNRGDLLYLAGSDGMGLRIRRSNGSIIDLSHILGLKTYQFWKGLDGEFYISDYFDDDSIFNFLRVTVNDSSVNSEAVITMSKHNPEDENNFLVGNFLSGFATATHKHLTEESIVFATPWGSYGIEFFEKEKIIKGFGFLEPGTNFITNLLYASENIYLASGLHILKIPRDTYVAEDLIPPSSYEIFSMELINDDEIVFSALRFQDGKKVIGTVDSNGSIRILEEEMNAEVILLERIN